jgi:hypothetical protein
MVGFVPPFSILFNTITSAFKDFVSALLFINGTIHQMWGFNVTILDNLSFTKFKDYKP